MSSCARVFVDALRLAALIAVVAVVTVVTVVTASSAWASSAAVTRAKHVTTHPRVPSQDETLLDADDARFFLTRIGFAPDRAELARYVGLTREEAVERVLHETRDDALTPMPAWIDEALPSRDERKSWSAEQRRDAERLRRQRYDGLRAWWVQEMRVTPSPLTERMTLFWHNHFTSGEDKVPYPQLAARQNRLLRHDALGHFDAMLHDVAKDPAMLLYLDGASNRKGKPNENFAREAMELFTLGEGQYTQRDVSEAARAYTGWSVDPDTGAYISRAALHDDDIKTVLGHSGRFDGDDVLDILLAQPQTATFIVGKLWREFVSDTPDPNQVAPIAARFQASGYDIKVALRALFLGDAFWNPVNRGVLVKSPVEFTIGTMRAFDVGYDDSASSSLALAGTIRSFGENLFYPPNVKGWPGGSTWINSSTLLARKQFVERLFRSTESVGPPGPTATMTAGIAGTAATPRVRQRGMRFDIEGWLASYGASPAEPAGLSAELQMQHAVLPFAPVDAIDTASSASAYLEALLMDPAYQLK